MKHDDLMQALSQALRPLPSDAIEASLASFDPYQPDSTIDQRAEGGAAPPFVIPFYTLVLLYGDIPSPKELRDAYFAMFSAARWGVIHNGLRPGIEARLQRAYPSLVRDLHLWALLHESGLATFYALGRDRAGIDVTVQDPWSKEVRFIHAYIDTPRARAHRAGKVNGPAHIDLPLVFSEAAQVNGYALYTGEHVDRVWCALGTCR